MFQAVILFVLVAEALASGGKKLRLYHLVLFIFKCL